MARATHHVSSFEAELSLILERSARKRVIDIVEARARVEWISRSLLGCSYSDSVAMSREDRNR